MLRKKKSDDGLEKQKEILRKLIGAALSDLIAFVGSTKEPFIIGGQYKNDKLIEAFKLWLYNRKFSIDDVNREPLKSWLNLCQRGMFTGPKGFVEPPPEKEEAKPPVQFQPDESSPPLDENDPDPGYFNGDEWKPKEKRKKNWTEEGEDWKDGFNEDEGFQPT